MLEPHPTIPSAWTLTNGRSVGGPAVGILAGVHGDEPCGVKVIERMLESADQLAERLRVGRLLLAIGNPAALDVSKRFLDVDLNRQFSFAFEAQLPSGAWGREQHRALELKPMMSEVDALIDLHSTTSPTQAFSICPRRPEVMPFAAALGLPLVVGWEEPLFNLDSTSLGPLTRRNRPAVAVECGQHDDPLAVEVAFNSVFRFLGALRVLDHEPPSGTHPRYKLFARIKKPSEDFAFLRQLDGLSPVTKGEVIGRGRGVQLAIDADAIAVLPTPGVQAGEDLVFLARPEQDADA